MEIYKCSNNCCTVKIKQYDNKVSYRPRRPNYRKAGVFIYDPTEKRVLLVQSRGSLWGCPKGTLNIGESPLKGAKREVKEETGIDLSRAWFTTYMKIKDRAVYYYLEMKKCDVEIQTHIQDNDANGITWIKMDCLEDFIVNGSIVLNHYARIVFKRFLGKIFPKSEWVKVKNKNKNKNKKR